MQVLNFPEISVNGNIKPEYIESYNRRLTDDDVDEIARLVDAGLYQEVIDKYNVRTIIRDSYRDLRLINMVQKIIDSGNLEFIKFIFKKISYDDRAQSLYTLESLPQDPMCQEYLWNIVGSYREDYSDEFNAMRRRFGRSEQ